MIFHGENGILSRSAKIWRGTHQRSGRARYYRQADIKACLLGLELTPDFWLSSFWIHIASASGGNSLVLCHQPLLLSRSVLLVEIHFLLQLVILKKLQKKKIHLSVLQSLFTITFNKLHTHTCSLQYFLHLILPMILPTAGPSLLQSAQKFANVLGWRL